MINQVDIHDYIFSTWKYPSILLNPSSLFTWKVQGYKTGECMWMAKYTSGKNWLRKTIWLCWTRSFWCLVLLSNPLIGCQNLNLSICRTAFMLFCLLSDKTDEIEMYLSRVIHQDGVTHCTGVMGGQTWPDVWKWQMNHRHRVPVLSCVYWG